MNAPLISRAAGDTKQPSPERRPDQDRLDPAGVLTPEVIDEHVGDEIHARPVLLEEIGDDRDLQRGHEPATRPSKNSTCRRATTDHANSVRARSQATIRKVAPLDGIGQHASQCRGPRLDIASGSRMPASPSTCGISPLSTGEHRNAAGHGLDQHPAKLLTPSRRRLARRAEHIHRVQVVRHLVVRDIGGDADAARVGHATTNEGLTDPDRRRRTAPATVR